MEYNLDKAVDYHYGAFPPNELNHAFFINELVRATDVLARYDQMLQNLHNNEILLAPLRNREALISSRIEGTISTMDEILQYEADEEGIPDSRTKSDVIETILYQRTLKNAQKMVEDGCELSIHFIRQMHQQLLHTERGASKHPGQFKTSQNYLVDKSERSIRFIPIRPESLVEGLENLFRFVEQSNEPVLIKTALMHLEFEALHPFNDGNGQIGRMLITLYLWREKVLSQPHFYISDYFETHKEHYVEAMRHVSQTGNWDEWIRFFLIAVEAQGIHNLQIAEKISDLYERLKIDFEDLLSSKWNLKVLDYIFTYPVFRNNKFIQHTDIPAATAGNIIKKLLENDYLKQKEPASGRRAALYSFEPLMELIRV